MSNGIIYHGENQDAFTETLKTLETEAAYKVCVTSRNDTSYFISVIFSKSKMEDFVIRVMFLLEAKGIEQGDYLWTHSDAERIAFIEGFKVGIKNKK
jgi:hypothetical protein